MRFILFVFLSLQALTSAAQDTTAFNEIGLNATPFINQYPDFGDDDDELLSPFVLTYEHRFGTFGGRIGIGLVSSTDLQQADDDNTEPSIKVTSNIMAIRCGAVLYKDLSKRFSFKYGSDVFFIYGLDKSVTTIATLFGNEQKATVSTLSYEVGLSPFFFLQYHVTPQFSLGTELLGRMSYLETVQKEQDSQFPAFDDVQRTKGTRFSIEPPTALFFILRF